MCIKKHYFVFPIDVSTGDKYMVVLRKNVNYVNKEDFKAVQDFAKLGLKVNGKVSCRSFTYCGHMTNEEWGSDDFKELGWPSGSLSL